MREKITFYYLILLFSQLGFSQSGQVINLEYDVSGYQEGLVSLPSSGVTDTIPGKNGQIDHHFPV